MPARIAEEVGVDEAAVLSGHDEQIVRPDRPMQTAVLNQTGLEINEWLLRLDFKGRRVAVAAECYGINVTFPI